MSNPKHRTPIPEPVKESQRRIVESAIDLGQAIEKHKAKEASGTFTADPVWRDRRLKIKSTKKWWQIWRKNV